MNSQIVKIGEVKQLLKDGKKVKVKTINNEFTEITNFVEKGILKTYEISLENNKLAKVSKDHLFFTDIGWVKCKNIVAGKHMILNNDNMYYTVKSKKYIGKERIVDISVKHPEKCYFGNDMLHHNTGKSLLGAHALASTQKKGGIAVYIDTESAVSSEFLEAIGVDISRMLYVQLETVEEIFEAIERIIVKIRESDRDRIVTILVDSVAAASTKIEMEADFDKDGWSTAKAIIISKALRKITQMIARQDVALIFTQQLRQKLGVMFGDPWTTSGGKSLGFHSSVRIRLKNTGQIKDKKNNTIGIKIRAQVIKNRLGPPLRSAEFSLYFDKGIDDYGSWLKVMKDHDLVKQGGAWYTLVDQNGNDLKFLSKDWTEKLKDVELKKHVYDLICEKVILKYQSSKLGIDDVVETNRVVDD